MADDEPYEILRHGEPSGIVEIPVEWIRDDAVYFPMERYAALRPYASPRNVLTIWIDEFEGAYADRGLFQLTMHPHVIGHRSRMAVLTELIDHITSRQGVWFATHAQVAQYALSHADRRASGEPRAERPGRPSSWPGEGWIGGNAGTSRVRLQPTQRWYRPCSLAYPRRVVRILAARADAGAAPTAMRTSGHKRPLAMS